MMLSSNKVFLLKIKRIYTYYGSRLSKQIFSSAMKIQQKLYLKNKGKNKKIWIITS